MTPIILMYSSKDINTKPVDMDISEADNESTLTAIFVDEEYNIGSAEDKDGAPHVEKM